MKKLLALLFLFLAAPAAAQEVVFFGWYSSAPFTCDGQTKFASYGDTTLVALQVCNGTSWKTLTTGSGTTNTVPKFTPDGVTLGNSTITDDGTVITANTATTMRAAADGTGSALFGFLNTSGTLPASAFSLGSYFSSTVNAASTGTNVGLYVDLLPGGTPATAYQAAGYFDNRVLNSGNGITYGLYTISQGASANRIGVGADAFSGTTSSRGIYATASSAAGYQVGGDFRAYGAATKIGVYASLTSTSAIPSPVDAAALFDNAAVAAPIAIFRDNGTAVFTVADSASVTGATTVYGAAADDGTAGFLNIAGTLPAIPSASVFGLKSTITGAGSAAFVQGGLILNLAAGYTGAKRTAAGIFGNASEGTGAAISDTALLGNIGLQGLTSSTTVGANIGVEGYGENNGVGDAYGGVFLAPTNAAGMQVGSWSLGNKIGAVVSLGTFGAAPTLTTTALLVDNAAVAAPIAIFRDNGIEVFSIQDDTAISSVVGRLNLTTTLPTAGTVAGSTFNITSSGSAAATQYGFRTRLLAGYTGATQTIGAEINNFAASTFVGTPMSSANYGLYGISYGTGTNDVGIFGDARNGTANNWGVVGLGTSAGTNDVGGYFEAHGGTNNVGVVGTLATLTLPLPSTAALFDNAAVAAPIAIFRDNGSTVFTVADSASVTGATTVTGAMTGSSTTSNFLNVTGTMPAVRTAEGWGTLVDITPAGSSASSVYASVFRLNDGFAGAVNNTASVLALNTQTGNTGRNSSLFGYTDGNRASQQNVGVYAGATNAGAGGVAIGGNLAANNFAGNVGIGVLGTAITNTINIGGVFTLDTPSTAELAALPTAGIVVSNDVVAAPIAVFLDATTPVFSVEDGGNLKLSDSTGGQFYEITKSNLAADRQLALPLLTATDTFAVLGLAQTFSQTQTISAANSLCLQDTAGGDQYCLKSEGTAPAGTTTLALNVDPATCTGDGNGGKLTVNGSSEIICSADAGGAGGGLTHPQVMVRASYGGF